MSAVNIASLIRLVLLNQTELLGAVTDSGSHFGWLIEHVIEIVIERGARSRPTMNEIITNCRTGQRRTAQRETWFSTNIFQSLSYFTTSSFYTLQVGPSVPANIY